MDGFPTQIDAAARTQPPPATRATAAETLPARRSGEPRRLLQRLSALARALPLSHPAWHWLALAALTLLAGALRFFSYERPPLWGDEAATFSRVTGSYADLLAILRNNDGFMPLHYSLYWLLGQFYRLDPFMMRLPVAVSGTLMVPAMYLLGRQVADRRTALLAAAFAACSAWLMIFSRDAKMYMPLWLAVTLNMGCLMWWLNTRSRIAFWGWIAAGVAMVGIHSPALALLPLQPLLLLTQRRHHWKHALLCMLGLGIIAAGPAIYYTQFSRFVERTGGVVPGAVVSEEGADGDWRAAGLSWIEPRNRGRSGRDLVFDATTAYLFGYEWTFDQAVRENLVPYTLTAATIALTVMMVLLVMGALPWPHRWRGGSRDDPPVQPWWTRGLWVSAWLIFPIYGFFYPRSIQGFSSPGDWLAVVSGLIEQRWDIALLGAVGIAAVLQLWRPRLWPWMTVVVYPPLAVVVAHALIAFVLPEPSQERTAWLFNPWVLTTALMLGPAMAWYGSSDTFRGRMVRLGQFVLLAGVLLALCVALYQVWSHMAAVAQAQGQRWVSMWMTRYIGIVWPAVGLAAAMLIMRLPTLPVRIVAIVLLLGVNLVNGVARVAADTEPPLDRLAADLWRGIASEPQTLTFVERVNEAAGPAMGWLNSSPHRYYLALEIGDEIDWRIPGRRGPRGGGRTVTGYPPPQVFRSGQMMAQIANQYPLNEFLTVDPRQIRARVAQREGIERVIVWERKPQGQEVAHFEPEQDPILRQLQRLPEGD